MAEAGSTHRQNGTGVPASLRAEPPEEAAHRLRLERDARRVEVLRALGPNSVHYVRFGLALRDFAMGTLVGQWRDRQLLREVKKATSISLGLPPSNWDFSYVRSIIAAAVSQSVEPFLDSAVLQGGWTPAGGARSPPSSPTTATTILRTSTAGNIGPNAGRFARFEGQATSRSWIWAST